MSRGFVSVEVKLPPDPGLRGPLERSHLDVASNANVPGNWRKRDVEDVDHSKFAQKKRPMSIPTRTHKQIESNRDMQIYAVQSEVWYGMGNDGNDFPNNLVVLHIVKRWWNHWQKVDECSQSIVKLTRDLSHGLPGESWWLLMLMTSYRWALRLPPFFSSLKCKRLARPSNFPETSSILESDPWASLMIFMQTSEISEEKCMLPMLRSLQWWPCSLASKQLLQLGAVETS